MAMVVLAVEQSWVPVSVVGRERPRGNLLVIGA